jgi:hypothetical protein
MILRIEIPRWAALVALVTLAAAGAFAQEASGRTLRDGVYNEARGDGRQARL